MAWKDVCNKPTRDHVNLEKTKPISTSDPNHLTHVFKEETLKISNQEFEKAPIIPVRVARPDGT